MSDKRTISFIIRTYNEAAFLGQLFATVNAQSDIAAAYEFVVVDSASTDGTVEIAKAHDAILVDLPQNEFNYSKGINWGIERSRGDLIVIISAHAIPTGKDWLGRMVSHFADDRVAGAYCRQVPWPDAYWREVVRLQRLFGETSQSFESSNVTGDVPFSNAASCIRRSIWEKHPFTLPGVEDIDWATRMVAQGYKIIYEAGVSVYHSHQETCRQMAKRVIEIEKVADLRSLRQRKFPLTVRQAISWALRDAQDVLRLKDAKPSRPRLIWDCFVRGYWFVRDFQRR